MYFHKTVSLVKKKGPFLFVFIHIKTFTIWMGERDFFTIWRIKVKLLLFFPFVIRFIQTRIMVLQCTGAPRLQEDAKKYIPTQLIWPRTC